MTRSHAIPTFFALAGMLLLLAVGGFGAVGAEESAGAMHSHTHVHSHDGWTHIHRHHDPHNACSRDAFAADAGDGPDRAIFTASLPTSDHGCCHEDHTHHVPVFALAVTGSRFTDPLPAMNGPIPERWQPTVLARPLLLPIPPPRSCPGDALTQLRTVVMLT